MDAFTKAITLTLTEPELREFSLAIASISVVVWTGALIALQIKNRYVALRDINETLMYAFIAPLAGLLFASYGIRLAFGIACLTYLVRGVYHMQQGSLRPDDDIDICRKKNQYLHGSNLAYSNAFWCLGPLFYGSLEAVVISAFAALLAALIQLSFVLYYLPLNDDPPTN